MRDFYLKAHEGNMVDFSFCDKNEFLYVTGSDSEIALWDIRNMSKRCFTIHC